MGLTRYRSIDKYSLPDVAGFATALRKTGAGVESVEGARYSPDGKLVYAEFGFVKGVYKGFYVYSPGYRELPVSIPHEREYQRINDEWYYYWEDWN